VRPCTNPAGRDIYYNESQQRVLRLLVLLSGNEVTGLMPSEISAAQNCSAPMVTRDLFNLQRAGLAELVPETSRWRLAPQVVQIALKHMAALDRAEKRLDETRNRYSRS
jgi:DNA-binding IclR family transcriptional regulator